MFKYIEWYIGELKGLYIKKDCYKTIKNKKKMLCYVYIKQRKVSQNFFFYIKERYPE